MIVRTGCIFFLLCASLMASAQTISIQGVAPDYAGTTLRFCTYSDYITYAEDNIMECTVDASGNFSGNGHLAHEGMVFARSGIYFIYFYALPDGAYTLHLPPYEAKSSADSLNPFYEELPIHAGVHTTAAGDINRLMLEGDCKPAGNAGYEAYCRYREGMEKYQSVKQKVRYLSVNYFRDQPALYYNEAYMDLFNQIYGRYFEFAHRQDARLTAIINRQQGLSALKTFLLRDSTFRDNAVLELVILKNLYDNFYANIFQHEGLLSLAKEIEATTPYHEHKTIAGNIIHRVTLLMPGYAPPPFELYDTEGALHRLDEFRGKALYLIFCKVFSYGVINAFEKLFTLHNVYRDVMNVAVISVDDDPAQLKNFRDRERYRWHFLHYSHNPDILKQYDIKALPTYFLLDKEGKLLLSPAPSPFGNIEDSFMKLHDEASRQ
ncbi:MAG: peroxiredoxin family protein [Prevotellaceae bacterium]|jgi:peroxiredoxin|nr:peroxiredoxin family protein [Prevotellaceae bacterium]